MVSWVALRQTQMDLRKILLFLFLVGMFSDSVQRPERAKEAEVHHNNSVIKSIKTDDGDIFDCFEINKQPSLNHPLLKNHVIEMRPSSLPTYINDTEPSSIKFEGCPIGTVPIQRVLTNDSIKDTSSMRLRNAKIISVKSAYYGARADINLWGLPTIPKSQYSAHEVNPAVFGDHKSRLFTWWTVDGGMNTGCFNTRCQGFVHVSKDIALGSTIAPLSTYKGRQQIIRVFIYKARDTGNWWFLYNGKPVGYWPLELLKHMNYGQYVNFGGVTSCPWDVWCGAMGSGHFPSEDFGKACFMRNVQYMNDNYVVRDLPVNVQSSVVDCSRCYDVGEYKYVGGKWGYAFYYGGPGNCI